MASYWLTRATAHTSLSSPFLWNQYLFAIKWEIGRSTKDAGYCRAVLLQCVCRLNVAVSLRWQLRAWLYSTQNKGGFWFPSVLGAALFWSTGKRKSGLLCKLSSFSGWEIQKQCSFVIHKHIYGIFDKLLDHISHDLITSLKLMWSLDVLHNNLGGIYFLHLGGGHV